MIKQQLSRPDLDSNVYDVVKRGGPIKADAIFDKLRGKNAIQPYEVARSIWRLVDRGKVTVRAGKGVLAVEKSHATAG